MSVSDIINFAVFGVIAVAVVVLFGRKSKSSSGERNKSVFEEQKQAMVKELESVMVDRSREADHGDDGDQKSSGDR